MYYQHGGVPRHYSYNWGGLPFGSQRAATTRGLGDSPVAMSMEAGRMSVLHPGVEQTRIFDSGMGVFGLSKNENRLLIVVALAGAGYLLWKSTKK